MKSEINKLSIVIPAYKVAYLQKSLESISNQTDNRFVVYVGDDASPEDIEGVCKQFKNKFKLFYHKFSYNLGRRSIVQQWNRCVRLSKEPWIWLFSDDDMMSATCVAQFYQELEKTQGNYNLYRFNTCWIDGNNNIIHYNPEHPREESSIAFVRQKLRLERMSTACEYIFSKEAFDRERGFIDFPVAWCSDDASWAAFADHSNIYTIEGPRVFWRLSGQNISTSNAKYKKQKIKALFKYFLWLTKRFKLDEKERLMFYKEQQSFLYQQLNELHTIFDIRDYINISWNSRRLWKTGFATTLKKLNKINGPQNQLNLPI